jgi:hypothetical protein
MTVRKQREWEEKGAENRIYASKACPSDLLPLIQPHLLIAYSDMSSSMG